MFENKITLHLFNSFTKLTTENPMLIPKLKDMLAIHPDGYQFSEKYKDRVWDGYIHFVRRGKVMTGLLIELTDAITDLGIEYDMVDHRVDPLKRENIKTIQLKGKVLRDYQVDAIAEAIIHGRGIIEAATNAGKTTLAAGLIQAIGLKTLFLTHREELITQTEESLEGELDCEVGKIWKSFNDLDKQVVVGMVPTLQRRVKKKEIEEYLKTVELLIIDEAHHASADTYEKIILACENAYYRIGLSGTPWTGDPVKDAKLKGLIGPTIFSITNKELIDSDVSSKPKITFRLCKEKVDAIDYEFAYKKGIVFNEERNLLIAEECKRFMSIKRPTLVVVNFEDHGMHLREVLIAQGIKEEDVQFISGNVAKKADRKGYLKQFKEGKLPILISSLILQEGVSINSIGALIFALGGKSDIRVLQIAGRALRHNNFDNTVEIVDFFDFTNTYLIDHTIERYHTYLDSFGKENFDPGSFLNV